MSRNAQRWYYNPALMVILLLFLLPLGLVALWCSPHYSRRRKAMYTVLWTALAVVTLPFSFLFWLGMCQTCLPGFSFFDTVQRSAPHDLGHEQSMLLTLHGIPDDYTIRFVYLDPQHPLMAERLDEWDYYGRGQGYTFSNGIRTEVRRLNPADRTKEPHAITRSPREFRRGQTWRDLLNESGQRQYQASPGDDSGHTVQDGLITLGFDEGLLVYVSTRDKKD
ncbi:MAG: hypothetical protein EOM20_01000 [Spartobacteria bacterium]|nr:hypothetical protein [Spartobacteria bacterium]